MVEGCRRFLVYSTESSPPTWYPGWLGPRTTVPYLSPVPPLFLLISLWGSTTADLHFYFARGGFRVRNKRRTDFQVTLNLRSSVYCTHPPDPDTVVFAYPLYTNAMRSEVTCTSNRVCMRDSSGRGQRDLSSTNKSGVCRDGTVYDRGD